MTRIALAPCSPFSVSPALMTRTAELAETLDVRLHTHLCETFDEEDLASLHQGSFTTFMTLVEQHDPDRKFANDFTRRLFGRPK